MKSKSKKTKHSMNPSGEVVMSELASKIRPVRTEDAPRLQAIRRAAFAPVFASFRAILGDELYQLAQAQQEAAQGDFLASMLAPESGWEVYVAEAAGDVVGFVSVQLDHETKVGELGLNAVDPAHGGQGIGTAMYDFALARMKDAGMKVATVSTGGDPSHAPARRAYQKAGFAVGIPSVWLCRTL
jgi:ribosomal protein S18 acetylase RimI-like enzyme